MKCSLCEGVIARAEGKEVSIVGRGRSATARVHEQCLKKVRRGPRTLPQKQRSVRRG